MPRSSGPCCPARSGSPRQVRPRLVEREPVHPRRLSVPQSSATRSTEVLITNSSAPICCASSEDAKSLSMTAATPSSTPSARRTTGIPPPPTVMTMKSSSISGTDRVLLDDAQRAGRGDHAPPATAGILDDVPSVTVAPLGRLGLVHVRADRLGRVRERRVVRGDLDLGDDGDGAARDAHPGEVVLPGSAGARSRSPPASPRRTRRAAPRGARGTASSERRRMNPTCGPLPCPIATRQPSARSSPRCARSSHGARRCTGRGPSGASCP